MFPFRAAYHPKGSLRECAGLLPGRCALAVNGTLAGPSAGVLQRVGWAPPRPMHSGHQCDICEVAHAAPLAQVNISEYWAVYNSIFSDGRPLADAVAMPSSGLLGAPLLALCHTSLIGPVPFFP